MYTAIIVDDEPWIIEGLKAGVDWGERGFSVIGDARNGQEALALIERLQPDFVLTDIKMPLLNGLELIKKGKAVSKHTLFVVLSGHAEFTYAQKALNFGAFGYCLKPFEIEEIQSMLKRLSKALAAKKNRPSHDHVSELYEAICAGEMDTVKRVLEENGMPLNDARTSIIPIVVQGKELPLAWPNIKHLGFRMSLRRYGFLVYEHHVKAFLQSVVEAYGTAPYSIGIGHSLSELARLEGSVESASLAAYGLFSTGKPGIYYSAIADSPIVEHLKGIADAITRKDRIQFVACMESTRVHFHDGTFRMNDAYLLFTSTMYLFTRDGMKAGGKLFEGYQHLYEHFGNVDAMLDYLIVHTSGFIVEDVEARTMSVSHKKIKDILLYIHNNYTQEITIPSLSEKFQLSPNYLCHLFKKEVGENFVEYVSRQRIQYACKLLVETTLSIHEIGEKCGFNDYFYFTRIFKRIKSMSPTQYREKQPPP